MDKVCHLNLALVKCHAKLISQKKMAKKFQNDQKSSNMYVMKSLLTNGGPIEKCTFIMRYIGSKDNVVIDELTFHRKE